MKIYVTRDSVAAGDDSDAPHGRTFTFTDATTIEQAIAAIATSGYLASISGGQATWSVVSGFPIAVVAQQWPAPRPVSWQDIKMSRLQRRDDVIGLHFNYHTQVNPEIVLEVLKRLQLNVF
jgi:hypothetical protein